MLIFRIFLSQLPGIQFESSIFYGLSDSARHRNQLATGADFGFRGVEVFDMECVSGRIQRVITMNILSSSFKVPDTLSCMKPDFNPLKTKRRPLYLKTQSVPSCKHFSSRL